MDMTICTDDTVAVRSNTNRLAVVERTHSDVDTHEPRPGRSEPDRIRHDKEIRKSAFRQFMQDGVPPAGTVLVRWQNSDATELIPESKLKVLNRSLLVGDVVKKSPAEAMSGVVINTFTQCTLQPICDLRLTDNNRNRNHYLKGLLPPTRTALETGVRPASASNKPSPLIDIPAHELMYGEMPPTEDDLITYKGWIGRVDVVTSAILLRLADNCVVEIPDELVDHADGMLDPPYCVGDVVATKKGNLRTRGRWVFGAYNASTPPVGTVVETRTVSVEVAWFQRRIGGARGADEQEPPGLLEREELESVRFRVYDRTRRPQRNHRGPESSCETISNSEIDVRLGLRVRFRDLTAACVKYDGSTAHGTLSRIDRKDTLGYDLNVFDVIAFSTAVTVQWQDLSLTHENSVDVVPDASIDDEHAAWPGEVAHTLDFAPVPSMSGVEQPSRVGVVQKVDAAARMAWVRWCPDACVQYAILDPMEGGMELGIGKTLLTGAVSRAIGEVEEVSLYDVEAPAPMNVRRGDVVLVAKETNALDGTWADGVYPTGGAEGGGNVDWVGEVVDTCMDGSLTIRLGVAETVRDVNLSREDVVVAVRSDGTGEIDPWDDEIGLSVDGDVVQMLDSDGEVEVWTRSSQAEISGGEDEEMDDDGDDEHSSGVDVDSEGNEVVARYEDENGEPMDEEDVENEEWESDYDDEDGATDEGENAQMVDAVNGSLHTPPTSLSATPSDTSKRNKEDKIPTTPPEAYLILDTPVPPSHHFASQLAAYAPTHMKRMAKEHKILRSPNALPTGVYVRTWDSRLDLLRVLFVGPAETPYADAPFVIDFYLPTSFPSKPPEAYFHSWTLESGLGGVGRVNPNLYEDGKICLSLLGTWGGSKGEGWTAGRSTLLQVIVSLLGLVLVREPYFNEAGYEPLAGLENSRRPSALYNERTFLRARTFVVSALSRLGSADAAGLEGLEDVLRWLYRAATGPELLKKTIGDVQAVLERSEKGGEELDGMSIMSKGACIPLRRVLDRLRVL